MALTKKRRAWLEQYLQCWNATEAARRVGYKHPNTQGPRLLLQSDIRQIIDQRLVDLKVDDRSLISNKQIRQQACFVYLVRAENGLVKIGKTSDMERRFKTLDTMCPVDLEIVGCISSELADELEDKLHAEFDDVRVKGEWFALSLDNIESIKQRYEFD